MIAIKYFISLVLLLLLSGCANEEPNTPLRIASSPWPGYEPLYLARDINYLPEDTAILFELPSSDITMESFRNHSTDLATLTLDETLELLQDGIKLKILLIMDISNGGDAVIANPEIKTLSDIKNKRISMVNIPLGLYMLNRLLEHAGLERKNVSVFPMAETKMMDFYLQDKADVFITFDPVKTQLVQKGLHVLFDSSDIPNEIFDLLVVHEDVYQQRKQDICHIVQQWFNVLSYIDTNRSDSAKRITQRLRVDVSEFDNMMSGIILPDKAENRSMLGGKSPGIFTPANKLMDIMLKEKQLSHRVDISASIDSDFANCYSQ
ncbi:MAG: ABC transporter substrate-binding protein [Gammaproteobacteria bacterium]|nr:ABC transporter substrate-binding protein [Gammaproteobacteria bacterium]